VETEEWKRTLGGLGQVRFAKISLCSIKLLIRIREGRAALGGLGFFPA